MEKVAVNKFRCLASWVFWAILSIGMVNCDDNNGTNADSSQASAQSEMGDTIGQKSEMTLDTTAIDEAAVPYVSLLELRKVLAEDSLIGALIADGTKDYYTSNNTTVLVSKFPKPPQAYDQLSFLVYLEDLQQFEAYLAATSVVETSRDKFVWPPRAQQAAPNAEALKYPLVRKEYLSAYCPACLNAFYLPLRTDQEKAGTQVDSRYGKLLNLYGFILDPSVKKALYKNELAFAYEAPDAQARIRSERELTQARLARQFNDKALREVDEQKQYEAKRLQTLYELLKIEARNRNYLGMGKPLDEILHVQEEMIFSFPVQDNIIATFKEVSSANDFPDYLKEKAQSLKAYDSSVAEPNGRIVAGPAMRFAKQALQTTPLTNPELDGIQAALKDAQAKLAEFTAEQDRLKKLLSENQSLLHAEEAAFFELYQQSFRYHINVWERYSRQLQELLAVPQEDTSFSYLLLQDQAVREREKALAKNQFMVPAKKKLRKLREYYYQQLRAKEVEFERKRVES